MRLTQLNMISRIFYVDLFLMAFIGAMLAVNNIDNHYIINKVKSNDIRLKAWMTVLWTMIGFPLGIIFVDFLFSKKPKKRLFKEYIFSNLSTLISSKDKALKQLLYFFSFLSFCSLIYTILILGKLPFLEAILGADKTTLARFRIEATIGFSGNSLIKNIFGLSLSPILTYIAYSYYQLTNKNNDKIWFFTMLIITFFMLTYHLEKSPFFLFLTGFLFNTVLIKGRITKKFIILILLLFFFGITLFYSFFYSGNVADLYINYNTGITGRIILSQISSLFLMFQIFPNIRDHIGFDSLSRIISTDYKETAARQVMEVVKPEAIVEGTAGVMNTIFVGEAWANFGFLGVLIAPIYVGMIIGFLYLFFLKNKKTPVLTGLFTYFSYKSAIMGGFNTYIYNAGYLIIFIVFFLLWFILYAAKDYHKDVSEQHE
ncbi:MAG: hypothetical protein OEZ22_03400 [Spirochaetia bacterium]|nr:hypothetical protein [Spirochaetia bacterium]